MLQQFTLVLCSKPQQFTLVLVWQTSTINTGPCVANLASSQGPFSVKCFFTDTIKIAQTPGSLM